MRLFAVHIAPSPATFSVATEGAAVFSSTISAQLELQSITDETSASTESFVFGAGIVNEKNTQATGESIAITDGFPANVLVLRHLLAVWARFRTRHHLNSLSDVAITHFRV